MDKQTDAALDLECAYIMLAHINEDLTCLSGLLKRVKQTTKEERVLVFDEASGHIRIKVI